MAKAMRHIPLKKEFMEDKKVNGNLYSYLQINSHLDGEGKRFIYKANATPTKIVNDCKVLDEKGKPILKLSSVKTGLKLFEKLGLIESGKVEDLKGKAADCYYINQDPNHFQLIPLDTLRFLVNFTNGNVIKVYAYLLNKSQHFNGYTFTRKELLEAIGYTQSNGSSSELINDILFGLTKLDLIEYVEFWEKDYNGNPTPKMRLIKVSEDVK